MKLLYNKSMESLSGSFHARISESRLRVNTSHQEIHVAFNITRVTVMPFSSGLVMAMSFVTQAEWPLTATTSSQRARESSLQ